MTRLIVADPDLARVDRIAIALGMSADTFSVDDIVRVTSIRRQVIVGLRSQTGLPDRPYRKAAVAVNRPLQPVVDSLAKARGELKQACRELGIHHATGWGIDRALQYAALLNASGTPVRYRCPGCDQITPEHPCHHCGTTWLGEDGKAA
jgi:hypothetical protein